MDSWDFKSLDRGHAEYEKHRCGAVWNSRIPDRYPDLIVFPEREEHVQKIVLYAKQEGLAVGIKSGGHSWTASFLRDGGILIDLIKMNNFTFDAKACTAEAEPACWASNLNAELLEHDLMFPACESVQAVDVVTADGTLIHANSTQNSEFFWAARGAGCGYFGVITRFYLRLHSLPHGIMNARYVFEIKDLGEVVMEIDSVSDKVSPDLEINMCASRDQDGFDGPTVAITADALSETEEEAKRALDLLHELPSFRKTIKSESYVSCSIKEMMQRVDYLKDNRGIRFHVNNLWTDVSVKDLLPAFHEIISRLPPRPSRLYMTWWLPVRQRPEMAFSMEGRLYIGIYGMTIEKQFDALHSKFGVDSMRLMEKQQKGIGLADENLPQVPGKFMSTSNYVQLERLRRKHDPERRFHTYLRVPEEFEKAWSSYEAT